MSKNLSFYAMSLSMATLVSVALVMIGCGSSNSMNNNLTQAQAQAVASALSTSISQSVAAAFGVARENPGHRVARVEEPSPRNSMLTCTMTPTGEVCSATLTSTYNCAAGGSIAIAGSVSGTLNSSGTGSIQDQVTATPSNCVVDNLTLNGDPSVTVAGSINLNNDAIVWPVTGTETGGVSFGPHPSGSCQFNVNFSVNVTGTTLTCTTSGTACGHTVSGSC